MNSLQYPKRFLENLLLPQRSVLCWVLYVFLCDVSWCGILRMNGNESYYSYVSIAFIVVFLPVLFPVMAFLYAIWGSLSLLKAEIYFGLDADFMLATLLWLIGLLALRNCILKRERVMTCPR